MTEIRMAAPGDLEAILSIYAPYVLETTFTFEYEVPSEQEFARRMQDYQKTYPWLVFVRDGRIEGYAYASPFNDRAAYRWSADLSIYLAPDCRGRGVGRQLYECLMRLLAAPGVRNVYGLVTDPNPVSFGFHTHMGFHPAGCLANAGFKHGRWLGVNFLEKHIAPAQGAPRPLIPIGRLPAAQTEAILSDYRHA